MMESQKVWGGKRTTSRNTQFTAKLKVETISQIYDYAEMLGNRLSDRTHIGRTAKRNRTGHQPTPARSTVGSRVKP